jgi:hypothetical protein
MFLESVLYPAKIAHKENDMKTRFKLLQSQTILLLRATTACYSLTKGWAKRSAFQET